jgi:hypothetical protein
VDWSSIIIKLSLVKKLVRHTIGGRIVFFMGYICIERMIWDKIVRLTFLGYNIDTDLPFREQNFDLWVRGFFFPFFFLKTVKIQSYPRGGKYACVEGFHRLFFLLKQFKYKITFEFQQKTRLHVRVFSSFLYGCQT